ncbi:ANTAR domain-containing protein [Nocardioides guangzhouensis]|uniref:ANTAR domain-containing protein n=1 Tax=Nocardioides guangzhouensis TaxID=2497878 RepID=UPI003CCC8AEE
MSVARRQAEHTQLTEQLRDALATRAGIDQALGILMAQQDCTHDQAFAILRSASQHQNRNFGTWPPGSSLRSPGRRPARRASTTPPDPPATGPARTLNALTREHR